MRDNLSIPHEYDNNRHDRGRINKDMEEDRS